MHQYTKNTINFLFHAFRRHRTKAGRGRRVFRPSCAAGLFVVVLATCQVKAQEKSPDIVKLPAGNAARFPVSQPSTSTQSRRPITIDDAVSVFLKQNLQLIAARYDVDIVEAEQLSARLHPDPQISIAASDIPLAFTRSIVEPQTLAYGVSQTFELGGKRQKRIEVANTDSELAHAQFEAVVWQLTNDVKKKFYTALLAKSQLDLSNENQKTFDEIVRRTDEVFKLGEISGLDLQRL